MLACWYCGGLSPWSCPCVCVVFCFSFPPLVCFLALFTPRLRPLVNHLLCTEVPASSFLLVSSSVCSCVSPSRLVSFLCYFCVCALFAFAFVFLPSAFCCFYFWILDYQLYVNKACFLFELPACLFVCVCVCVCVRAAFRSPLFYRDGHVELWWPG